MSASSDPGGISETWSGREHPRNPTPAIQYCVLEGPEVGTYVRGSVRLVGGSAAVTLPDHFADVTDDHGLTVQLAPCCRSSKGLCATTLTVNMIVIEELFDGVGEYDVHYIVQGVRKGCADFRVVRPRRRIARAHSEPESNNPGVKGSIVILNREMPASDGEPRS